MRRSTRRGTLIAGVCALLTAVAGALSFSPAVAGGVERPFILWTKEEATAIREKIETERSARAAYKKLANHPDRDEVAFSNLLR